MNNQLTTANMSVWNQVCVTDPDMTEKINFGAFKFTTIDSMYQVRQATQLFGPCGQGWGVRNQNFEMLVVDPSDAHYNLLMYTAQLWYKLDGQEGNLDIAADIELFENTKNGWKRVSDPMKKVRTAALSKGLSWLGFSADVFLGKFDDARYVSDLKKQKQEQERQSNNQPSKPVLPQTPSLSPSEMPSEAQLAEIQRLAALNKLAGADFAAWLRGSYGTSWSKMTAGKAAEVIKGLNQLLEPMDEVPADSPLGRQQAREVAA